MSNIIAGYKFGDMAVSYVERNGVIGLLVIPDGREADIERGMPEPLVQFRLAGTPFAGSFSAGHTMANSPLVYSMRLKEHKSVRDGSVTTISTVLESSGFQIIHRLCYREGDSAFETSAEFVNLSGQNVTLELLTSLSLGYLTPFESDESKLSLTLHRAHSYWSAEGRLESVDTDALNMEKSWASFGERIIKFGQTGSMPVRTYFPFAAVTDNRAGVTWAAELGVSASWQIELARGGYYMAMRGGLADYDFGHFRKVIADGGSFVSPVAYITVGECSVDAAAQRLTTLFESRFEDRHPEPVPVFFNEYCTTWGVPSHENISKIIGRIGGMDIDYFVIDAGWYAPDDGSWGDSGGDWQISKRLFPEGLDKTVRLINDAGMKAGIWFELETCAPRSTPYNTPDMLLLRDGAPLTVGGRRFLDMRKPEIKAYLDERVTGLLAKYGFKYMKVDYNESIGMGCDGGDSLGAGLYDNIEASKEFFRSVKKAIPDIMLEVCSSGGHRLEPSFLGLFDIASFSDAHECVEIPIIARNLQRLMLPSESQIWAVLRGSDGEKRVIWSIAATFYGVMCLSGDIYAMSDEVWKRVGEGIAFYRSIADTIKHGVTEFVGDDITKYRHPVGWQGIIRHSRNGGEAYALAFMYGGDIPETVEIDADGYEIASVYGLPDNKPTLSDGKLRIHFKENLEAVAVRLVKKS